MFLTNKVIKREVYLCNSHFFSLILKVMHWMTLELRDPFMCNKLNLELICASEFFKKLNCLGEV